VTGLKALKNLKILSLGRNCLKKMDGIGISPPLRVHHSLLACNPIFEDA
jgi:hypothetical protein